MTQEHLRSQFLTRLKDLPGSAAVRAERERAMSAFKSTGFPTCKAEDWRYTDVKPIATGEFDPVPDEPSQDAADRARLSLESLGFNEASVPISFIDGHPATGHHAAMSHDGLTITSLAETWDGAGTVAAGTEFEKLPFAALNTAFASNGLSLRVTKETRVSRPIHVVFLTSDRTSLAPQPRIAIDLAPDSQLQLVLHLAGADDGSAWTNLVSHISQGPRSRLTLYRLQELPPAGLHTELLTARLGDDASLEIGYIDLGGKLVRNDVRVDLAGPGARCDLFGIFMANEGQHVDDHIRIDHSAPRTVSRENFKGIIGDRGRGVFNGKVVVHRDAQNIDATQSSDNLLLSERGEIDTKPELEIYADDVKCSHGATVGQLDEDKLFYLRSRGLDDMTASGLLTFAFANEILQRLDIPEIRQRITRRVLERLPGQQRWDEFL